MSGGMKSNYPRPKDELAEGPAVGPAVLSCVVICVAFIFFHWWPGWLKQAFEDAPLFLALPVIPAFLFQIRTRGIVHRLLLAGLGYVGALFMLLVAGFFSSAIGLPAR